MFISSISTEETRFDASYSEDSDSDMDSADGEHCKFSKLISNLNIYPVCS